MTLSGTFFLCLGMALCAYLIDRKTEEQYYQRVDKKEGEVEPSAKSKAGSIPSKLYWVQPGNQNIGDQLFDSFGYSDEKARLQQYITSYKNPDEEPTGIFGIWFAVIATSLGFICQFLGLRACHSSVSVMQLGITLIMSIIRASLRAQRLSKDDNFMGEDQELFQGHELDCLALKIAASRTYEKHGTSLHRFITQPPPLWMVLHSADTPRRSSGSNLQEDAPSVLKELPIPPESPPILTGFRVRSHFLGSGDYRVAPDLGTFVEADLARWLSNEYYGQYKNSRNEKTNVDGKGKLPPAVKAFLYRSRLARMTGLEKATSVDSENWDDDLIPARKTAVILAQAIEDTMQVLFNSDSEPPVTLRDSWKREASIIFWTLEGFLIKDNERSDYSKIRLSLRRATDQSGTPEGPWTADRSELEAVLGLWSWSLKNPNKRKSREEADSTVAELPIKRLLFVTQNGEDISIPTFELKLWLGQCWVKMEKEWIWLFTKKPGPKPAQPMAWKQNGAWGVYPGNFELQELENPGRAYALQRIFGWHNLSGELTSNAPHQILQLPSKGSLLSNCAQEIYSAFLAAILLAVEDIGGRSTVTQHQDSLSASNENVEKIQKALVARGLCDEVDAFSCTIPVLRKYGNLQLPPEVFAAASDLADKYRQVKEWTKSEELVRWKDRCLFEKIISSPGGPDSRRMMEAMNNARLSVVERCEIYSQALQDDEVGMQYGLEGILNLVDRFCRGQGVPLFTTTPLVWIDHTDGRNVGLLQSERLTFADTIKAYGQVALWHLQDRNCESDRVKDLRAMLGQGSQAREPPHDFEKAVQGLELDITLYLLSKSSLREPLKTAVFDAAVRGGWYMVVQHLVKDGADIDGDMIDGQTALWHATQIGDINMVRVLIKEGATLRNKDPYWNKPVTPYHVAALRGHAIIMEDLMKKWPMDQILNHDSDGKGNIMTPLNFAIKSGNPATVRALLCPGSAVDPNHRRYPALHYAIKQGRTDMVEVLLEQPQVDPNLNHGPTISCPPLICAVRLKKDEIFDQLLRNSRVDVNSIDRDQRTAVWWAAALGLGSYIQKLIDSGKVRVLEKPDREHTTPHKIALETGHLDVYNQLQREREWLVGKDAILVAAQNGHMEVVKELLPRHFPSRKSAKQRLDLCGLSEVWPVVQDSPVWDEKSDAKGAETFDFMKGTRTNRVLAKNIQRRAEIVGQLHNFTVFQT